ncbi:hypothetical protein CLV98_102267 [Dyadobacter jejuensis]|uniref:Uncharacterized protein n=1 Tax=Dyadobacter jejuensis TaxID=1082580 RepID=A0A316AQH5_9BACT|nr:hypothetical protein [Dyadobacter jejuensis]PWJ59434.1 hypothetical protein CLV98_102267 [Dyadobacter jejuensis]
MTKRSFILFVSLISFMISVTFSLSLQGIGADNKGLHSKQSAIASSQFGTSYDDQEAILQADESEWRENLNDLLRHRGPSYRFSGIDEFSITIFCFGLISAGNYRPTLSWVFCLRELVLPDYYYFLHRLCPF